MSFLPEHVPSDGDFCPFFFCCCCIGHVLLRVEGSIWIIHLVIGDEESGDPIRNLKYNGQSRVFNAELERIRGSASAFFRARELIRVIHLSPTRRRFVSKGTRGQ